MRATFEAIAAQCPLLLPHVAGVSASFASIVAARIALPKSFALAEDFRPIAPEIRRLMATLSECWADRAALEQFLVCTFWLPTLVGAIFGFRKHFMLIDHIDLADAMIGHAPPFDEAPTNAFVIEIVKLILAAESFVVSCKEIRAVGGVFPKFSETTGIELTDGITVVSTLDVVPAEDATLKEFIVSFWEKSRRSE